MCEARAPFRYLRATYLVQRVGPCFNSPVELPSLDDSLEVNNWNFQDDR